MCFGTSKRAIATVQAKKTKKQVVLEELRKGFHTAYGLAGEAGTTESAVRRIVWELRAEGYSIKTESRGYELSL